MRGGSELNDDDIRRRLDFLLKEVKQRSQKDQVADLVIRQLGNYFWTRGDSDLYRKFRFRSKAAYDLSQTFPKDWYKNKRNGQEATDDQKVTNDHWEPVRRLYAWMCEKKDDLTADDVKARILRWPIVVMTKEEHDSLSDHLEPEKRYLAEPETHYRGITELRVLCDGVWQKVDLQELMKRLEQVENDRLDPDTAGCSTD